MAIHRKAEPLLALNPDVAVIGECADPHQLAEKAPHLPTPVWKGHHKHKGLAVFTFNGYSARRRYTYDRSLDHLLPVHIEGPQSFDLLAVWALNLSGGNYRKDQPGPLRIGLDVYKRFLMSGRTIVTGDLNNNVIWDRPGWPINHIDAVEILDRYGLASVYHERTGEAQGVELTPTIYWRDRTLRGPTYHLDYAFIPHDWLPRVTRFEIGTFGDWVGSGWSDHVPLVLDIDLP